MREQILYIADECISHKQVVEEEEKSQRGKQQK